MKKALAMKCTQEQWDSIKDRVPEEMIIKNPEKFIKLGYLTNDYDGEGKISFTNGNQYIGREIHETFSAKIFLDACGIETDVFEITKGQVLELSKMNCVIKEKLCDLFPDAFKKELEVGKWYKSSCSVFFVTKIENEKVYAYGINDGKWLQDGCFDIKFSKNDTEAAPQEVESALISEAKKRRYLNKLRFVKCLCDFSEEPTQEYYNEIGALYYEKSVNKLWIQDGSYLDICIFDNGQWATIIHPEKMTLEQIEKELGRKIQII